MWQKVPYYLPAVRWLELGWEINNPALSLQRQGLGTRMALAIRRWSVYHVSR
jgi:hypothetical protein